MTTGEHVQQLRKRKGLVYRPAVVHRMPALSIPLTPTATLRLGLVALAFALVAGGLVSPLGPSIAAAHAAPAKGAKKVDRKVRARATALVRKIQRARPGSERYRLVDQLIELGDGAWPAVAPAVPGFLRLPEGEAVAVDVLLGFMDLSYGTLAGIVPKLSDSAARRVVKFLLRLDPDKRQIAVLSSLVGRKDHKLLLLVLPALMPHDRPRVMKRLTALVDDRRPQVAAYAIDTIAANRHVAALPSLVRLLGIEQRRASPTNLDLRRKLIHAIARIGGEPAVPPLLESLELLDQRPAVYEGMRIVGKPAVQAALFLLRTATGPRIAVAMELLAHMRTEAAPHLVALLSTASQGTRDLIIDVLIRIATPEVRSQLVRMVREGRFTDVRDGVRILGALYDAEVRHLYFELLEDPDPATRRYIVEQLWRLRDPKTFKVLRVIAAQDKDRNVRLAAVRAVAGVQDPKGPELLARMAVATDPVVRLEVVEQLSRVGDWRAVVPALSRLLADPNDRIFRATLDALQRMTFQPLRRRGAQWRAWHRGAAKRKTPKPPQADELPFHAGEWRFAAQQHGRSGPVVLVASGPPFRDATHLALQASRLAPFARVVVMRRAPGHYRSGRQSQAVWSREVDAMARAVKASRYTLLVDTAGAGYALRHAGARKQVRSVVVSGGWLPSTAAVERLPGELAKAMGRLGMADWSWAVEAQWRVPAAVRLDVAYRGLLRGLLGLDALGLLVRRAGVLADDALSDAARTRAAQIASAAGAPPKPTLLLLGSRAPWAASVTVAVAALPKGHKVQLVKIPRAGAMPLFEVGGPSARAVKTFLGE